MKHRLTVLLLIVSLLLLVGCATTAPESDTAETTTDSTPVTSTPETDPQASTQPEADVTEPTEPDVQESALPESTEPVQSETTTGALTREEALAVALKAAALTEDDILYIWAEYEIDDGIPEYEVEFRTADTEYDYTIHAETGAILSWDQEVEHADRMTAPTDIPPLTEAEVIIIALAQANLSEADVTNLHVEYDAEDGDYEVEFHHNNMEYTYEINAATGTVRDYEVDD